MSRKEYLRENLYNDVLFQALLVIAPEIAEYIIQLATGDDSIKVTKVVPGFALKDLRDKSVIPDVIAFSDDDVIASIDVQKRRHNNLTERAMIYFSKISLHNIIKGVEYAERRKVIVIFLCEFDPFGEGKSHYEIYGPKTSSLTGRPYYDGGRVIFVNGAYKGNGPFRQLLDDFKREIHKKMRLPVIEKGVVNLRNMIESSALHGYTKVLFERGEAQGIKKGHEKGRAEGIKEGRAEGIEKGREEGIEIGLAKGHMEKLQNTRNLIMLGKLSDEEIAETMRLSLKEVKDIREEIENS